jgi:multidrug efflux pump subunit AcrA (membrane-fusion protein)
MGELQVGQTASFRVNGYTQSSFTGRVKRIDAAANATTRQVAVIVAFTDPATAPKVAGLFAEGRVETGRSQALMLPEAAVARSGDAAWVWRVSGKTLSKLPVKLGERDARSGNIPVTQGLASGDRVLRNPGNALIDGQAFEWAPSASASAASAAPAAPASK